MLLAERAMATQLRVRHLGISVAPNRRTPPAKPCLGDGDQQGHHALHFPGGVEEALADPVGPCCARPSDRTLHPPTQEAR